MRAAAWQCWACTQLCLLSGCLPQCSKRTLQPRSGSHRRRAVQSELLPPHPSPSTHPHTPPHTHTGPRPAAPPCRSIAWLASTYGVDWATATTDELNGLLEAMTRHAAHDREDPTAAWEEQEGWLSALRGGEAQVGGRGGAGHASRACTQGQEGCTNAKGSRGQGDYEVGMVVGCGGSGRLPLQHTLPALHASPAGARGSSPPALPRAAHRSSLLAPAGCTNASHIRRAALRCAALQAGDAEPFSAPEFYEQPEMEESQTWDAPAPIVPWSPPAVAAAAAAPEGTAAAAPGEGGGTEAAGAAGAPPGPAPPADPRLRYAAEYAALADWLRARPQQLPQFALPPAEPGEA